VRSHPVDDCALPLGTAGTAVRYAGPRRKVPMSTPTVTNVTALECEALEACRALEPNESRGDAIHLRLHQGSRHWLVQTDHGQWSAVVRDALVPTGLDLHVPMSDRVACFIQRVGDHEPTLSVADRSRVVIATDTASAAIDLVPWMGPAPEPSPVRVITSIRLPLWRFARALNAARVLPTGADDHRYPSPPMMLQIDSNGLRLDVDWHDFLPSSATYWVAGSTMRGSDQIALPHRRLDDFLRCLGPEHRRDEEDESLDVELGIGELLCGSTWRKAVVITHRTWQLALIAVDVLIDRWGKTVEEQLQSFDILERQGSEWLVDTGNSFVRVNLRRGHPDTAKVIAEVGIGYNETLELLRELSTLNAASEGVRFWFEGGVVWAAMELPCTRLDDLAAAVCAVSDASVRYGLLLSAWS